LKIGVRLITLDEKEIRNLMSNYSFYTASEIPAGTYEGFNETIIVPAVNAMLICGKDIESQLVYEITKVLYEKIGEITNAKKSYIKRDTAVKGVPIPFHPGAKQYYQEIGLIKD